MPREGKRYLTMTKIVFRPPKVGVRGCVVIERRERISHISRGRDPYLMLAGCCSS